MNLHCFIWYRIFYCLGCSIIMLNFNDLKLEPCRPRDDHWYQKIPHCYFTPNKIVFQFTILKIQYSQRHGMINHCDRHITPLSDTDISLGLFTYTDISLGLFTYTDISLGLFTYIDIFLVYLLILIYLLSIYLYWYISCLFTYIDISLGLFTYTDIFLGLFTYTEISLVYLPILIYLLVF